MPITKSAKKSLKVSRTKLAVNKQKKAVLEKALRTVDEKTVNKTVSLIDRAAKTGLMHKNKAARLKSRLAKKLGTPATAKSKVESQKPVKSKEAETEKPKKKAETKAKKNVKAKK